MFGFRLILDTFPERFDGIRQLYLARYCSGKYQSDVLLKEVPFWWGELAILMGEMWFFLMGVEWDSTDFSQDGNPTSAWFYVYHAPPTNQLIGIWLWHIPSPTVGSTRYGVWTYCTQNPFWWFIAIFLLRLPVGSTYVFQTTPGFSKSCETRSHHPS
jgi:hypothetical protein